MGKPFFVMERRRGHVIQHEWPTELSSPEARMEVAGSLVDGLDDLHLVDPEDAGLGDLGNPEGFVKRQIAGWTRRWFAAATRDVPDMEVVATLLGSGIPEAERTVILHNDYKLDNTMVSDDGSLVAVFDWDMATRGDPLVDVGTLQAYWVQPDDPTYLDFGAHPVAIGDIMSKENVRDRYAQRTGLDLSGVGYFGALALFRIAAIIEQIYARFVSGQTSDQRFAAFEPIAPILAAASRSLLEG